MPIPVAMTLESAMLMPAAMLVMSWKSSGDAAECRQVPLQGTHRGEEVQQGQRRRGDGHA